MSRWKTAKRVAYAILALIVLIIIFRNMGQTRLELILTSIDMPLAVLLLLTLAIGFAFGLTANAIWQLRKRHRKSGER